MSKKSTFLSVAVLVVSSFTVIYCNDHRTFAPDATVRLVSTLSGSAEKPTPVPLAATGWLNGNQ